jgi:deoxyribodipyrimidine photolyase
LSELGWREFNWNILFHFPGLAEQNFRPEFDAFSWNEPRPAGVEAWQRGRTGIPLVDAGMRELWRTGYMHNRVRLVTAAYINRWMPDDAFPHRLSSISHSPAGRHWPPTTRSKRTRSAPSAP